VSSQDIGLPLGVRALAIDMKALPKGTPFQTGGGTARLVYPCWVIWAKAPDKFEAGTPAIVNVIAFAKALQLLRQYGNDAFRGETAEKQAPTDILCRDDLNKYSGRELLGELRQTLIGRNVRVPTAEGDKPYINLDNGASTPTFMPIWNAVCQTWRQPRQVRQEIIQEVKSICAGVLGAPITAYDVIFTSNTTEAINLTAESVRNEYKNGIKSVVLNTVLEHNSNDLPWRMGRGFAMVRLSVDAEGFVDLKELETLLCAYNRKDLPGKGGVRRSGQIRLVAVSGASNVLGTYNNLVEISRIVHRYGARLLVDAAQLVAHRTINMDEYGIDYLAFSAHKVYAPFGSGVLLVRKGLLKFSASQLEQIQLSGEENVGGIAALGKALMLLQRIGLDIIQKEEQSLTGRTLRGLAQIPGLDVYGVKDPNSPRFSQKGGVIAFRLEGMMANRVAKALAERGGIGVRSGCHCAHLLIKKLLHIPPPLKLLQGLIILLFPQVALPGLTRVSLGIENTEEDVDALIHVLRKIGRQPRAGAEKPFASPTTDTQRQIDNFVTDAAQRVYNR
jgi:selenocysteine lyase/cysteine desulfurase